MLKTNFKDREATRLIYWLMDERCILFNIQSRILTARFICLFVWGLSSHSRSFHSLRDVTITGEVLQILIYARHSWPLSSEGSLACLTYCDTGHPFIIVISEDPWHSHLLPSVWQWSCHYLILRLRAVAVGMRIPNLPLARRTL